MVQKDSVIVITGPTASGKTSVSLHLAKQINGEIVCADSMQIYKDMDIGTAKATIGEQNEIPHHMIDIITPEENFSVASYKEMASTKIKDILSRGKVPIVCGGTGQYISALLEGTNFIEVETDAKMRKKLEEEYDRLGKEYFYEVLNKIDPVSAQNIHPNDKKRVIRAIEIYKLTNKTKTQINEISKKNGPEFKFISFCINHDRDVLYSKIDKRVDEMIDNGLIKEVKELLEKYPKISKTATQAIGYKEIISFFEENISSDEAINKIKQNSRNYAKRQLTWFRKVQNINWTLNDDPASTVNSIKEHYEHWKSIDNN